MLWLAGVLAACSVPPVAFTPVGDPDPDAGVDAGADAGSCLGACACTAETEASVCAAHAICDESAVCRCVPAYREEAGACVFAGAPADPMLRDPAIWSPVGVGAAIVPEAPGVLDPGEAVFEGAGICQYSSLVQTFEMPPRSRAEPFKLVVSHSAGPSSGAGLAIGVGGQWIHTPPSGAYRTDKFCLGARAYGGNVVFRIATLGTGGCPGGPPIRVDQLRVEPATEAECPPPGVVVNGDFEQVGGWRFEQTDGATFTIASGLGEAGSAGARIVAPNRCSSGTLVGSVALPASGPQAIELYWNGAPGTRLPVSLGDIGIATLHADGVAKRSRFCVPTWARGATTTLAFHLQRVAQNNCAALDASYLLDGIAVIPDPACDAPDFSDPGFERIANPLGPAPGWRLVNGIGLDSAGASAEVRAGAEAHAGLGRLELRTFDGCAVMPPTASASFTVPALPSDTGPIVWVGLNVTPSEASTTFVELGLGSWIVRRVAMPEGAAWIRYGQCVPPGLRGRPLELRLVQESAPGCAPPLPTERAVFDDVTVETRASCPP